MQHEPPEFERFPPPDGPVVPPRRTGRPTRAAAGGTDVGRVPLAVAAGLLVAILSIGVVGAMQGGGGDAAAEPNTVFGGSLVATTTSTTTTAPAATPASAVSSVAAPELPPIDRTLRQGVVGDDVERLQGRLAELGFDPGPVDGIFGTVTTQAVWAFEKIVLRTPREQATGAITPESWDVLRGNVRVMPRRPTNGQANHTEVYLPEQVLVVFHQDRPVLITHISSGVVDENGDPVEYCETATYDTDARGRELEEPVTKQVCALSKTPGGVFTYDRQVEGKRVSPLGGMWNPVYFNYGIAVHGAENVPNEPASHGCVRLPMHISDYFQDLVEIGERILVWNGDQEPEDVSERDSLPSFDYADPNATTTTTTTTTTTLPPTTTSEPAATVPPTTPRTTTTVAASPASTSPPTTAADSATQDATASGIDGD